MRRIVLSSVACLTLPYFFHIMSSARKTVGKNVTERKMCFDFLYNFARNIFHSKKNWARCDHKYKYIGFYVKCLFLVSYFDENWISSTDFRKIFK